MRMMYSVYIGESGESAGVGWFLFLGLGMHESIGGWADEQEKPRKGDRVRRFSTAGHNKPTHKRKKRKKSKSGTNHRACWGATYG